MANAYAGDKHLASIDMLRGSTDDLTISMIANEEVGEQRSIQSKALRADLTAEQKLYGKVATIVKSSGMYMAYRYLKTLGDVGIAMGRVAMSAEEQEAAINGLSYTQRIMANTLVKYFRVTRAATDATDWLAESSGRLGKNTTRVLLGFLRFIVSTLTVVFTLITLGIIIAGVSIAMAGMDSWVVDLTSDMGLLGTAVEGLVMALTGEGPGGIFSVAVASLTVFLLLIIAFNPYLAIFVSSFIFMAGVFNLVKNGLTDLIGETAATGVAFVLAGAALGPFLIFLSKIPGLGYLVKAAITTMARVLGSTLVGASIGTLMAAFSALGAGIALIFWGMTNDIKGAFGVIISALVIFIGMYLVYWAAFTLKLTVLTLSAVAPIMLLVGAILLLIKYRKELGQLYTDTKDWLFGGPVQEPGVGTTYQPMAKGGPVSRGRPYLVGEEGPELFSPGESGNIISNDKLGGSSGTVNHINIKLDVSGVTDRSDKRALAREISDMLNQEVRRLGGQPTRGRF